MKYKKTLYVIGTLIIICIINLIISYAYFDGSIAESNINANIVTPQRPEATFTSVGNIDLNVSIDDMDISNVGREIYSSDVNVTVSTSFPDPSFSGACHFDIMGSYTGNLQNNFPIAFKYATKEEIELRKQYCNTIQCLYETNIDTTKYIYLNTNMPDFNIATYEDDFYNGYNKTISIVAFIENKANVNQNQLFTSGSQNIKIYATNFVCD